MSKILATIPKTTTVIVGGDVNGRIGTRRNPKDRTIGNFGLPERNDMGTRILNLARENSLCVPSTMFDHKTYHTHTNNLHKTAAQIDHFFISNTKRKCVDDVKRIVKGTAPSDHAALKMTIRHGVRKRIQGRKPKKEETIYWRGLENEEVRKLFQITSEQLISEIKETSDNITIKQLNDCINEAGKKTIPPKQRSRNSWFKDDADKLVPAINDRNEKFDTWSKAPTDPNRLEFTKARNNLNKIKRCAIAKWMEKIASECDDAEIKCNPKRAWEVIREIQQGLQGHHRDAQIMKMRLENGNLACSDEENADVFEPHSFKVYNRTDAPVDTSVLQNIQQRPMKHHLNNPPTRLEISKHIEKAGQDKAGGESGITGRALKALGAVSTQTIHELFTNFWNDTADYEEWHEAILKWLPKKGDLSQANNWRGICLGDALARIFSSILTARLNQVIKTEGIENQFGSQPGRGCQDGLYVIRTMLQMRRNHNLPTWGLFVDLVKAFDTANHFLLYEILHKYGVPPQLVNVIKRLYEGAKVKLKVGEATPRLIPYTVGVKQGDAMAPLLFLFLMQAFAETLVDSWEEADIEVPTFNYHRNRDNPIGRLVNQRSQSKGTLLRLNNLLYVDDGAFIFTNKANMIKAAEIIYKHFARFGLIMHIGRDGKKSKTEAMYFPPKLMTNKNDTPEIDTKKDTFKVMDGYVGFTDTFKYLGSLITTDLKDTHEIKKRVQKATVQMNELRHLWRNKNIKTDIKVWLYLSLPVNTLLWGCESWSMTDRSIRALEAFHTKSIRKILGISMMNVEALKITNEMVRREFNNITTMENMIKKRQLNWIGKLARLPEERLPRQLLAAWVQNPRKRGKPQLTLRSSMAKALETIIPESGKEAPLNLWLPWAENDVAWQKLISDWWKTCHPHADDDSEPEPLIVHQSY